MQGLIYIQILGGYVLELNSEPANVPILLGTSTDFTSLAVGGTDSQITRLNNEDLDKLNIVNNIINISKENSIENTITSIDINDERNYTLFLENENKTVYLGNCKDLNTRILYMKAILEKESGKSGEIYINADLDTGYVYFKESV